MEWLVKWAATGYSEPVLAALNGRFGACLFGDQAGGCPNCFISWGGCYAPSPIGVGGGRARPRPCAGAWLVG
jgi:hypothetical protein